MKKTSCVTKLN